MIETKCRICNADQFKLWGQKAQQKLYQCKQCEFVFFYPYPTQEQLDDFYNQNYHNQRGYGGDTDMGKLRKEMYALDVEALELALPKKGKILDFGCAQGVFLSCLSDGWERYGFELSKTALENAVLQDEITYYNRPIDELSLEDEFFDVIHLRGVYEHILHPEELIKVFYKKLKKDGCLVLSNTPNFGSIAAQLYRDRFKLVLPNEHVSNFTLKTLKVLFRDNNLKLSKVEYPYFNTPYESFPKDCLNLIRGVITKSESPPFWGNIFTVYATKM